MCIVKKPKSVAVSQTEKDPAILRNPYLDGIDPIIRSRMTGLKSLRVDAGAKRTISNPSLTVSPSTSAGTSTVSTAERDLLALVVGNKFAANI